MGILTISADIDLLRNQLIQARLHNSATAPTGPAEGQLYFSTGADKKFYGWNGTAWIDLSQIVNGTTIVRGEITNANTNPAFPGAPQVGDYYFITTTAGNIGGIPGTAGSIAVEIGDQILFSASGWFAVQRNLQLATQALAGFMRFATQAENNAGSDLTTAVSPGVLASTLASKLYVRKYRELVPTLSANTAATITHGLLVANAEDVVVSCYQGGQRILLAVAPTSVNALTVTSNQALANVTVVVNG